MNKGITTPLIVTTPKPWCELGVWFSSLLVHLVGTKQSSSCFVSSPTDPGRIFFHLWKTKTCSIGGDLWVCSKAWQCSFSPCLSWPVIKILFLLDKKLRHSLGYGANWLARIIVNYDLDLTNKFSYFLIRMIRVRLPSCHIFIIIIELLQLSLNPLHCL